MHCLALGGVDLSGPAGRMTMGVIAAVAEFERDLLVERTQAGLTRAKAAGAVLGRPPALTREQARAALQRLSDGGSVASVACELRTSRQTIMRVLDNAATDAVVVSADFDQKKGKVAIFPKRQVVVGA